MSASQKNCARCQKTVTEQEITDGVAVMIGEETYCDPCSQVIFGMVPDDHAPAPAVETSSDLDLDLDVEEISFDEANTPITEATISATASDTAVQDLGDIDDLELDVEEIGGEEDSAASVATSPDQEEPDLSLELDDLEGVEEIDGLELDDNNPIEAPSASVEDSAEIELGDQLEEIDQEPLSDDGVQAQASLEAQPQDTQEKEQEEEFEEITALDDLDDLAPADDSSPSDFENITDQDQVPEDVPKTKSKIKKGLAKGKRKGLKKKSGPALKKSKNGGPKKKSPLSDDHQAAATKVASFHRAGPSRKERLQKLKKMYMIVGGILLLTAGLFAYALQAPDQKIVEHESVDLNAQWMEQYQKCQKLYQQAVESRPKGGQLTRQAVDAYNQRLDAAKVDVKNTIQDMRGWLKDPKLNQGQRDALNDIGRRVQELVMKINKERMTFVEE